MDLDRIQAFLEDIAGDVASAVKCQYKDSGESWSEWCRIASCGGSRPLHRITKVKAIPVPAVAVGVQSGDPVVIVAQEVALYRKLWHASSTAHHAWVPDRSMCPVMEPDDIRKIATLFPATTASSLDTFHPRHLMLIVDAGLCTISAIWSASEAIGILPKQLCWIQMPMLGTPSGGNRLFILYAAMYRVWQRARRTMVSHIRDAIDRRYWGCSKGRSAVDCAWLQAARSESNQAAHKHGVLIVADWSKYYESIPLLELRHKFLTLRHAG